MNRSTYVYILMIVVLGAGLWLILRYGSAVLTAREDLAGEWTLRPLPGTSSEFRDLKVEQSGRFFSVTFTNAPPIRLKMVEESNEARGKRIRLSGSDGEMIFMRTMLAEEWRVTAAGKIRGNWSAELTTRMYPRAKAATRGT